MCCSHKVCYCVEGIAAKCILLEEVVKFVNLIMSTNCNIVVTLNDGEVILYSIGIGVHAVCTRRVLCTHIDSIGIFDVNISTRVWSSSLVSYKDCCSTECVGNLV